MIEGRFFDAHTSAARPASLEIGRDRMIRLVTPAGLRQVSLDEVAISDRVANVPRRIRFADGASFETPANDAVDAALAAAVVLTVAEPTDNGLGGDAFALVWHEGVLHGLN